MDKLDPLVDDKLNTILINVFENNDLVSKIKTLSKNEARKYKKIYEGQTYDLPAIIKNDDLKNLEYSAYVEDYTGTTDIHQRNDILKLVIDKRHLETKVIGVGAYGLILQSLKNNAVYKLLKLETSNNEYAFENVCKEVAIQNIISSIEYEKNGAKYFCSSPVLRIYKMDNTQGKTSEFLINDVTHMLLLEMNVLTEIKEPVIYNDFVNIFHDFLRILNAIQIKGIQFSHCDVKLNNIMKDSNGNLRLIDFGMSSIHFIQQTGYSFILLSPTDECGWLAEKNIDYPEKDVLQFLLSASVFDLDDKAKKFREYALDLFDHPEQPYLITITKKINKMIQKGETNPEFDLGYNFNLGLRYKLRDKMKGAFHMYSPEWILANFDTIIQSFEDRQDATIKVENRTTVPYIEAKGGKRKTRKHKQRRNKTHKKKKYM
jgi:serine/threonine protein kinase